MNEIQLDAIQIAPRIENSFLISLGAPRIGSLPLRNASTRWLPWFDAFESGLFNRFRFEGIAARGDISVVHTTAICDSDFPFRERRDSSGDLCFRNANWDTPPQEAQFAICFEPVSATVDGRAFSGFKYWYEYSGEVPIHRIVDRQTWELGGNLDDVTLCLRNWLTPPQMRIGRDTEYSTVGLDEWAHLLPGNLWARWSLLPGFDFQYGTSGVLVGWFDEVSLIRSVVESNADEDCLRVLDLHLFEQSTRVVTNAKTILHCPDILDDVDALNLWTRVHDAESAKARAQFTLPQEEAPAIVFSHNVWKNIRFESTYEEVIECASEFGADYVFIDPVWEHQQAWRESLEAAVPPDKQMGTIFEKWRHDSMCCTLDFEVAQISGGEAELKKLCERAGRKDLKILSWMACHLSPNSVLLGEENLATKESGRHPDTGYAASCWPIKAGSPTWNRMRGQLLGVCERTGLQGFLWDSFSNLGWWHLDYAGGTLAPQWPQVMELYRELEDAGLYLMPEAVMSFSGHSCVGLHGGNVYEDDLLGYSYNSNISLQWNEVDHANSILRGEEPCDLLFQSLAHKRVPNLSFHTVPREEWNQQSAAQMREMLGVYKAQRHLMQKRTVLKDGAGVLWENETGASLLFSFENQIVEGEATDVAAGVLAAGAELQKNRAYLLENACLPQKRSVCNSEVVVNTEFL